MRINVLQHTPNEGVGYIGEWAREIVLHDSQYIGHSILEQTADDILSFDVPKQNRQAIFKYGIQSAQSNKVFILKYGKSINIKLK